MAVEFERRPDFMYIKLDLPLTLEVIEDACVQFFDHPEFQSGMNVMWDARSVPRVDLSFEDMRHFGEFLRPYREHRGGGKSAFVASEDVLFGMFRMHEMLNDQNYDYEFHVFRNADEATKWLLADETV